MSKPKNIEDFTEIIDQAAFPLWRGDGTGLNSMGMTLRDFFAAAALFGHLSNPELGLNKETTIAKWSYITADAMLAEREGR